MLIKRITYMIIFCISLSLITVIVIALRPYLSKEDTVLHEIRLAQKNSIDEQGFAYIETKQCGYYTEAEIECPWYLDRPHRVDSTFVENNMYYAMMVNKFGTARKVAFEHIQIHNKRILGSNISARVNAMRINILHSNVQFRDNVMYQYVKLPNDSIFILDDLGNQVIENNLILIK